MPPLKVIVANGQIPMAESSNDRLAETLVGVLRHFGFQAMRLRFPLSPTLEELPRHLAAFRLIDLSACDGDPGDVLICLDLPTACLRHPAKVLWINHPYGGLVPSALPPTGSTPSSSELLSSAIRQTLERCARLFLPEAARRFSTSAFVAGELQQLADLGLRALWPPLFGNLPSFPEPKDQHPEAERPKGRPTVLLQGAEAGYLPVDRICDVVEASGERLAFAGSPAASGSLAAFRTEALFRSAADRGLDLIRLAPEGSGSRETVPTDGHSVRLEDLPLSGMWLCAVQESSPWSAWNALARKIPLVTTSDGGASVEMVRASQAGVVVEPGVDSVVNALVDLNDESSTDRWTSHAGARAESFLRESYPTWKSVVDDLVGAGR